MPGEIYRVTASWVKGHGQIKSEQLSFLVNGHTNKVVTQKGLAYEFFACNIIQDSVDQALQIVLQTNDE